VYKIYAGYKSPSRIWDSTTVRVSTTTGVEDETKLALPNGFQLAQNYPNPFFAGSALNARSANVTNISYSLRQRLRLPSWFTIFPGVRSSGWSIVRKVPARTACSGMAVMRLVIALRRELIFIACKPALSPRRGS
jgi:hypothetical protein